MPLPYPFGLIITRFDAGRYPTHQHVSEQDGGFNQPVKDRRRGA